MTSPNQDPTTTSPQIEFLPQDLQRLEAFAGGLNESFFHAQGNDELLQHMVESQIDGDVNSVQVMPGGEAVKLVIEAAALGATREQGKAQALQAMIERSPLLSQEDKGVITRYAAGTWNYRIQGIPESEIAVSVYQNALGDVSRLSDEEGKDALKLTLMAFTAGATIREHDYHTSAATSLIEEARRHAG